MATQRKSWQNEERRRDTLPVRDELYALIDGLTFNQRDKVKTMLLRLVDTGDDDDERTAKDCAIAEFSELVKWINDKDLPLLLNVVRSFTKNLR